MILFWIHHLVYKLPENRENAHCKFPEPKVMSSNGLFCPANSPKPKDTTQKHLTSCEPANVWHFFLINDPKDTFSADQNYIFFPVRVVLHSKCFLTSKYIQTAVLNLHKTLAGLISDGNKFADQVIFLDRCCTSAHKRRKLGWIKLKYYQHQYFLNSVSSVFSIFIK